MTKLETLKVSVELNGKVFEREVTIEMGNDKAVCGGHVGSFRFIWRPGKFDLPMLRLRTEQYKELYKGLNTAEEKTAKMESTRKQVKAFLLAYKELKKKMKTTELNGSIPIIPQAIPNGFELVSDHMFGADEG